MVGGGEEVFVEFSSSKKGEKVFFELESDKLFGAEISVGAWARWMLFVPGLIDGLCEEVDPASVSRRKGKGRAKGGGSYGNDRFIKL